MDRTSRSLTALLLGVAALVAGQGLLNTTAALALEAADVAGAMVSSVLAAYYLGWVLGCLQAPGLLRRVGHIRTFAVLAGSACAAALLHALVPAGAAWFALRVASGFCMAGLLLTVENWLTLRAPSDRRGSVLAIYLVVFHLAFGAGQVGLTLTGALGPLPYMAAALCITLASVPVAASRTEAPEVPSAARMGLGRLMRVARTAAVTAFGSGLLIGAYQTMGAVVLKEQGQDSSAVGLWLAAVMLGGLVLQWPAGLLSDRWDRRLLTTIVCLGTAGVSAALYVAGPALPALLLLGVAFGSLVALLYPLALAHGNDRVAPEESLDLGSTLVLVAGCGAFVGPLVAGASMARWGPSGLFVFCGVAAALLAIFNGFRMLRRRKATLKQSEPYVPLPGTTAGAVQLDPRVPEEEVPLLSSEAAEPETA